MDGPCYALCLDPDLQAKGEHFGGFRALERDPASIGHRGPLQSMTISGEMVAGFGVRWRFQVKAGMADALTLWKRRSGLETVREAPRVSDGEALVAVVILASFSMRFVEDIRFVYDGEDFPESEEVCRDVRSNGASEGDSDDEFCKECKAQTGGYLPIVVVSEVANQVTDATFAISFGVF
ncbi:hypothetical protein L1049_002857 [Liquidambar formosana]|uniref:Uncharacterized protein n=1 Tax=Liquidambar formosana TaxID=63359 RepID=A0AAP0NKX4_LIQFO